MMLKQIKNSLIIDFENRSDTIQRFVIYLSFCFHLLIFLGEAIFDFRLVSLPTCFLIVSLNCLLVIALISERKISRLSILNILLFYLGFQIHFIVDPQIFYFVIYWFTCIVVISEITLGIKQSIIWMTIMLLTIGINYWYLHVWLGEDEYNVSISLFKLSISAALYLLGVFLCVSLLHWLLDNAHISLKQQSKELEQLKIDSDNKRIKLEKYQKAHFNITVDQCIINGNFESLYQKICHLSFENIGVSRVSIWSFDESDKTLTRKYLLSDEEETNQKIDFSCVGFPKYLNAITTKKYIAADNASTNEDTMEFNESYLHPSHILSVLDCPFFLDGKLKGIICCENLYVIRKWSSADILFIQSLAECISLSLKSHESQSLIHQIQNQNNILLDQRHEIEAMNEKLSMMNDTLEQKVKERTRELEYQNKLLTEYAFINSHQLRAPLSRIQGLSFLIANQLDNKTDADLLNALLKSTNELDLIVSQISKLLQEGHQISREEIQSIIVDKLK